MSDTLQVLARMEEELGQIRVSYILKNITVDTAIEESAKFAIGLRDFIEQTRQKYQGSRDPSMRREELEVILKISDLLKMSCSLSDALFLDAKRKAVAEATKM